MATLSDGQVPITFGGEEKTLVPTLKAITAISLRFGGMRPAIQALLDRNIQAVAFVLQIGLDLSDKDAQRIAAGRGLGHAIFEEMGSSPGAYTALISSLIEYVGVLENGGKPLPDQIGDSGSAEGN